MPRSDRIAVRFAVLSLGMRAKVDPITVADFVEVQTLIDPLEPDDRLRLGVERFFKSWHAVRRDGDAVYRLACDLIRMVERDSWPEAEQWRGVA